jgi:putative membrane protein
MKAFITSTMLFVPLVAFSASDPDSSFYKHAAEAGIAEVELGQLAQDKAASQDVKDFGAMMVKDHAAVDDKLKSVAAAKDISLPTSASLGAMATETKLKVLSGESFDKYYIKSQLKAHREAIALFSKEATRGQDPEAKAFASATLPTLKKHLEAIQGLASTAGISQAHKTDG